MRFESVGLARKPRHLIQLTQRLERAAFLPVAHDLKAMALQLGKLIEFVGRRSVKVDHRFTACMPASP